MLYQHIMVINFVYQTKKRQQEGGFLRRIQNELVKTEKKNNWEKRELNKRCFGFFFSRVVFLRDVWGNANSTSSFYY